MRARLGLLACLAGALAAMLWALEPRLDFLFPSMVDDWSAIAKAPEQLRAVAALGNPEDERYRPGFILWNALQWHTLGAPSHLVGPLLWGIARAVILVVGVTLLAALLTPRPNGGGSAGAYRWVLVAGVPLVALTAPSLAVDLARYGPQEPLLVGCMSLGAVLLVRSIDGLLDAGPPGALVIAGAVGGALVWAFGVLQKETSVCVLLLLPFLWPTVKAQRDRWSELGERRRAALGLVAGAVLLPFVPMTLGLAWISLEGERAYADAAARQGFLSDLNDQLERAGGALQSAVPPVALVVAAVALVAVGMVRRGVDWLSIGMLVVAFAFVAFAAESGVVASRYYLPALVLLAVVIARAAVPLRAPIVLVTGIAMVGIGAWQTREANDHVWLWVDTEQARGSSCGRRPAEGPEGARST
jgi:hypothetical protein